MLRCRCVPKTCTFERSVKFWAVSSLLMEKRWCCRPGVHDSNIIAGKINFLKLSKGQDSQSVFKSNKKSFCGPIRHTYCRQIGWKIIMLFSTGNLITKQVINELISKNSSLIIWVWQTELHTCCHKHTPELQPISRQRIGSSDFWSSVFGTIFVRRSLGRWHKRFSLGLNW